MWTKIITKDKDIISVKTYEHDKKVIINYITKNKTVITPLMVNEKLYHLDLRILCLNKGGKLLNGDIIDIENPIIDKFKVNIFKESIEDIPENNIEII